MKKKTLLHDIIGVVAHGSHSIAQDDASSNFSVGYNSVEYSFIFIISCIIRLFLLIIRVAVIICFSIILILTSYFSTYIYPITNSEFIFYLFMKLFVFCGNMKIRHHGLKRRLKVPHIFISNHVSFIDFLILSSYKFPHASINENHGGIFGLICNNLLSKVHSISFKRSEKNQRKAVVNFVNSHIQKKQTPLLLFPEGTCVNNRSTVLFQKGVFEMELTICPVAIKYDNRYGEPYWNRRKQGFILYLLYILSRFGTYVDVYWMEPESKSKFETSLSFSHRLKKLISAKLNVRNSLWDGVLKNQVIGSNSKLLQIAYKNVFRNYYRDTWSDVEKSDITTKMQFFQLYHPFSIYEDDKIVFAGVKKTIFVLELCKEYLRLKSLQIEERDKIIAADNHWKNNF